MKKESNSKDFKVMKEETLTPEMRDEAMIKDTVAGIQSALDHAWKNTMWLIQRYKIPFCDQCGLVKRPNQICMLCNKDGNQTDIKWQGEEQKEPVAQDAESSTK